MSDMEMTKKDDQAVRQTRTPETDRTTMPDVDISETDDCIRLIADMPGVDQTTVDVSVEHNVLTIEGKAQSETPEGCKLVGQEYGVGSYRRDFTLADTVDTTGIKARVQHGTLEVTLPKKEAVKMRKIKIEN